MQGDFILMVVIFARTAHIITAETIAENGQ